jgi:hypothetical protein
VADLISLFGVLASALFGLVSTDDAAGGRTQYAVVTRIVSGHAADDRTLNAALRMDGWRRHQSDE